MSAEFSKEITTSVLWLDNHGLDIRCVRLRPYSLDGRIILDVEQIIPLPEAADLTIQIAQKAEEARTFRRARDLSKYDLTVDGITQPSLSKRALVLAVTKAAVEQGISVASIRQVMLPHKWIEVEGVLSAGGLPTGSSAGAPAQALLLRRGRTFQSRWAHARAQQSMGPRHLCRRRRVVRKDAARIGRL